MVSEGAGPWGRGRSRDFQYSILDQFRELISEKLLILLRDGPCLELIIVSSNFQASSSGRKITGSSLKAIDSSKKVLKITGPGLSRINSVMISARTVIDSVRRRLLNW